MVRREVHCRVITREPQVAQTSFDMKLGGMVDMMNIVLLAQRQSAWKVFFPPGYDPGTSGTTTDTTTTV